MKKITLLLALSYGFLSHAQIRNKDVYEITEMDVTKVRMEISIPGFDGYQTLKCDLHTHTIFSDGLVWPNIRVGEAWKQGLDAVAITDHIEYRPFKDILSGDLNESYKIAKQASDQVNMIIIKGVEITRSKPIGHLNALFIDDANPLDIGDPLGAIDIAIKQGAFIMWNHPGWPDDKSTLYPVHEELIANKKIHGIEVFNHIEYYPVAFDWCKEMNLAFMGNSDIHSTTGFEYGNVIRPMTLVFASEKTEEAIKEALFAGRSAAYFNGELAGRSADLQSLVLASLLVYPVNDKIVEVTNISDIPYRMTTNGKLYLFPARKTVSFTKPVAGIFQVENCHVSSTEKLSIPIETFFP